jgi:uncharacterized membrane protein
MSNSEEVTLSNLSNVLKATTVGGLLFLLPLILIGWLLSHGMRLASKAVHPFSEFLQLDAVIGPTGETVLAVLLLALISLGAGLFAKTRTGIAIRTWFDNSFLSEIPQYRLIRSLAEGARQVEATGGITPVLANIEGGWQIAYQLETFENGWVAVFLPQAPTPMSGNIMYLPKERVRQLEITMKQAVTIIKRIGIGSTQALRSTNLTLPEKHDTLS